MKKILNIITICLVLNLFLSGCGMEENTSDKDLQQFSQIEIYSRDGDLLNTITEEDTLNQFNSLECVYDSYNTENAEQENLKNTAENLTTLYRIIFYKTSAALLDHGALEKIMEMTIYEENNTIKEQIDPETIKGSVISEEYLVFYSNISEKEKEFITTLAEGK